MKDFLRHIPLPVFRTWGALCYKPHNNKHIGILMTFITDEEELALDNDETLTLERDNSSFIVNKKNTYCYGDVNLNNGSDDFHQIAEFDILSHLSCVGIKIYSDYDYKSHACNSPINRCRWTETFNPAVVAQQVHGFIGKPKKIILFRQML